MGLICRSPLHVMFFIYPIHHECHSLFSCIDELCLLKPDARTDKHMTMEMVLPTFSFILNCWDLIPFPNMLLIVWPRDNAYVSSIRFPLILFARQQWMKYLTCILYFWSFNLVQLMFTNKYGLNNEKRRH